MFACRGKGLNLFSISRCELHQGRRDLYVMLIWKRVPGSRKVFTFELVAEPISSLVKTYAERFHVREPYFTSVPAADLSLIIAMPSFKEPDILSTLKSLSACTAPRGQVEIIITINAPEDSSAEILDANNGTYEQIRQWEGSDKPEFMRLLVIREEDIPKKMAGAGMARKIGMDEAVQRWAMIGIDGPIICLDADCTVSENYLLEAEKAFTEPAVKAGHFYFEHCYQQASDPTLRQGIQLYELHLRCYILGLRQSGYPFAVHTVGSAMCVRSSVYAKAGGMNKRKAGEDFYFLHKVVPLGGWRDISGAVVYPSCRASDRVPFGTGRAQLEWQNGMGGLTYHPTIYSLMKPLFERVGLAESELSRTHFPQEVRNFLDDADFFEAAQDMKRQATSDVSFRKRFWQWMDGFRVLKLVHHLRDHGLQDQPVMEAAKTLLRQAEISPADTLEGLLDQFRKHDRFSPSR
jgi:hypothetical protein